MAKASTKKAAKAADPVESKACHCTGGLTLAQTLCPNCNGTTVVVPEGQSFAR